MEKLFVRSDFRAVGTRVVAEMVYGNQSQKEKARRDAIKVRDIFLAKQKIFCRFNPASELSGLNKNLGVWQKASPDMLYLAKRALFYNRESKGLYDPRVIDVLESIGYKSSGSGKAKARSVSGKLKSLSSSLKIKQGKIFFSQRVDFSGIAKGYIIDQAAQFLKKRGWKNFFINVNGDAYASGRNQGGEEWRLPIEGVRDKKAFLLLSNEAVATSGVIKKYWKFRGKKVHHLINPKNPGKFFFEIRSVLVLHKKAEWADGRAKILVLLGFKKGFQHAKKKKLKAFFVNKRGKVILTFSVLEKIHFSNLVY